MEGIISFKFLLSSNGSIGLRSSDAENSGNEFEELAQIPERLRDCGAKLVYLDLAGRNTIDSDAAMHIQRLHKGLESQGIDFEIRVTDNNLHTYFKQVELEQVVMLTCAS